MKNRSSIGQGEDAIPASFVAAFLLFVIYRVWRGKDAQWGIDILGGLLTLRCLIIFVLLNLLLLSELRAGGLLLMQLILFLPVITHPSQGRPRGMGQS